MKRSSSALALAAVLLMTALAGCGGKPAGDDGLVGAWRAELQLDGLFNSCLAQSGMSEVAGVEGAAVTIELAINDDGTYAMTMDEAALSAAVESVKERVRQGLADHLEKTFQPQGVSLDDALAEAGTSLDRLADQALDAAVLGQLSQQVNAKGRYEVQEDKLVMTQDLDGEPGVAHSYTLDGDSLTLRNDANAATAGLEGLQTMVFARVSQ